jgi:Tfp pilus assembly protein PilO
VTQRDRILLSVFAALVVLGGGWFGIAKPKRQEASKLDQQIVAARTELAGSAARAAEYRAARTSLRKHPEAFKQTARALPNRAATPELLRTLTSKAKGTGITMTDFKTTAGSGDTPGITSVGLDLSFTGDFLSLQRYLARLQRMVGVTTEDVNAKGRLMALKSVTLTPGDDSKLSAKVSATVYIMQADALAAGATPAPATAAPATGAAATTTASPSTAGGA